MWIMSLTEFIYVYLLLEIFKNLYLCLIAEESLTALRKIPEIKFWILKEILKI